MIIRDFYIQRPGRSGWPFKTDAPLIIDADAVLAFTVTFKPFKPVARRIQRRQPVGGINRSSRNIAARSNPWNALVRCPS